MKFDTEYNRRRLESMTKNRERKLEKAQRTNNIPEFSTEAGKDYYLELIAAEEALNKMREKYVTLEKEFNEYKQRQRSDRDRGYYSSLSSMLLNNEPIFVSDGRGSSRSSSSGD